ncbi:hypothetical protein L0F63_004448, partial [Massospora cicadina]
ASGKRFSAVDRFPKRFKILSLQFEERGSRDLRRLRNRSTAALNLTMTARSLESLLRRLRRDPK